jgi:transposase
METIHKCCTGLDVHTKTVVACAGTPAGTLTRTFDTMTADPLELPDWLVSQDVTHVAVVRQAWHLTSWMYS